MIAPVAAHPAATDHRHGEVSYDNSSQ